MSSMELLRRTLPPFMGPQCHDPVTSHTLPPRQGHHTGREAFNIRLLGGRRHAAPFSATCLVMGAGRFRL